MSIERLNGKYQFKVCGLGEVLWDVFPDGEKFGGAPANFTCHCNSLGADAYIISCLGRDERGIKARRFLDNHGVNTCCLSESTDHETGVVIVELDDEGKPEYEIKEDVAWDNIPWTEETPIHASRLDAVCFGSLSQRNSVSRDTIRRFLAATRPDCLRVFDINIRKDYYNDDIIHRSLEYANVLKLNDEELPVVAGMIVTDGTNEQKVEAIIRKYDLKLVALTLGPKGALMITPKESSYAVPPETKAVSTVGAGDSFTAAMIMGFLKNKPLDQVNREANRLAAFVCTQPGAVPELPEELTE